MGHMVTTKPSLTRRRVWCHGTRRNAGALLCQEMGSGAVRHVAMLEPFFAGRWGLAPWGTW
jgi:hypothetical protein